KPHPTRPPARGGGVWVAAGGGAPRGGGCGGGGGPPPPPQGREKNPRHRPHTPHTPHTRHQSRCACASRGYPHTPGTDAVVMPGAPRSRAPPRVRDPESP